MMHRFKKAAMLFFAGLIMISFAACQREELPTLAKMSPQEYAHISGYQITVPNSWQPAAQTAIGVYFLDEEKRISLNIISEMGGVDFYSPEELGQMVVERLEEVFSQLQVEQILRVRDKNTQYSLLLTGENSAGERVVNTLWLYEPLNGIRYYLIFSCGGDDYNEYARVFEDVIRSFRFDDREEEVLSLLNLSEEELAEEMKNGLQKIGEEARIKQGSPLTG